MPAQICQSVVSYWRYDCRTPERDGRFHRRLRTNNPTLMVAERLLGRGAWSTARPLAEVQRALRSSARPPSSSSSDAVGPMTRLSVPVARRSCIAGRSGANSSGVRAEPRALSNRGFPEATPPVLLKTTLFRHSTIRLAGL